MGTIVDHTDGVGVSNHFGYYFGLFVGSNSTVDFVGTTQATINLTGPSNTGSIVLTGTGLGFTAPNTFSGTVTGLTFSVNGLPQYTVTGISIALQLVKQYVVLEDEAALLAAMYANGDTFNLTHQNQGGPGSVFFGAGGNDTFNYNAGWSNGAEGSGVDGGAGNDTLVLRGAYTGPIQIYLGNALSTSSNVAGVETLRLGFGFDYQIALNDAYNYGNFTIDGSALRAVDQLVISQSISSQYGVYTILGGAGADQLIGADNQFAGDQITGNGGNDVIDGQAGDDTLRGGEGGDTIYSGYGDDIVYGDAGNDTIDLRAGGVDTAFGGLGNDTFFLSEAYQSDFSIDGGAGVDRAYIAGYGTIGLVLGAGFKNMEFLFIDQGGVANVSVTNAVLAAGQLLTIDATAMAGTARLNFNGAGEASGSFFVKGGGGVDTITGGRGADTLLGNGGSDVLNGGLGADVLTGGAGSDVFVFNSALAGNVDTIKDFNVPADTIHLENAIFTTLAAGALNANAFWKGAAAHDASDRIIYNANTGALFFDQDGNGAAHAAVRFATISTGLNLTAADFFVI